MNRARHGRLVVWAAVVGFAAFTTLAERTARGKDIEAHLDYDAAPGCPPAADFEAIVARHLGYSPFHAEAASRVVVRIAANGRSLEGRLEWRNDAGGWAGERKFPSRSIDCAELARAMGFTLALQFQLLASTEMTEDAPSGPPTNQAPPPAPIVTAPPAPPTAAGAAAPAAPSRASFAAGAGAAVGVGLAPDLSALGRVFGTVAWSHAAIELAAEVSVPSTTSQRPDGAGFSQQLFLGSLAGCGLHTRFSACVLAKVGEIRVVGETIDVPRTSFGTLIQTGARLAVTQMVGRRVHVGVHADGLVLLTRGVVTLDGMPVWTTPRVSALFGLDLGMRFQ